MRWSPLCTADAEGAKEIIKGDSEVNRMERDIEHRCMTLLLRQQPVASDLRFISAAMKVVTDVERIGDHAADIAEIVPHLAGVRKAGDPAVSKSIEMGRKAHKMLNDAMAAFAAEDEAAAKAVIEATMPWTTTSTASSGCWQRRSLPTPGRSTPPSTC